MLAKAGFQGGGLQAFSIEGIPDIAFSEMVDQADRVRPL